MIWFQTEHLFKSRDRFIRLERQSIRVREEVRPRQLSRLEGGRIQQVRLGLIVEFRREQELADLTVHAGEIRVTRLRSLSRCERCVTGANALLQRHLHARYHWRWRLTQRHAWSV